MNTIELPSEVKIIIDTFYKNNFEIFVVGGCVRDSLLHKEPKDWDLCTNALVEDIERIANENNWKVIPTGIKHGTVSVILNKIIYEITVYRVDSVYSDNRHPDKVEFTNDITKDLSRRDFTINAIAYNDRVGFVDPFNGIDDINNCIIKCVGNADDRFNEDGLRIMRAIRFAITLNNNGKAFTIENKTKEAIVCNCNLLKNISAERINAELVKSLLFTKTTKVNINLLVRSIFYYLSLFIIPPRGLTVKKIIERRVDNILSLDNIDKRLVALFKDLPILEVMQILKFDNNRIDAVLSINNIVDYYVFNEVDLLVEPTQITIKEQLNKYGSYILSNAIHYCEIIYGIPVNKYITLLESILQNNECYSLKQLAVNGNDLKKELNIDGIEIGKCLDKLLYYVYEDNNRNNYETLMLYAKSLQTNNL